MDGNLLVQMNQDVKETSVVFNLAMTYSSSELLKQTNICFSNMGSSRGLSIFVNLFEVEQLFPVLIAFLSGPTPTQSRWPVRVWYLSPLAACKVDGGCFRYLPPDDISNFRRPRFLHYVQYNNLGGCCPSACIPSAPFRTMVTDMVTFLTFLSSSCKRRKSLSKMLPLLLQGLSMLPLVSHSIMSKGMHVQSYSNALLT